MGYLGAKYTGCPLPTAPYGRSSLTDMHAVPIRLCLSRCTFPTRRTVFLSPCAFVSSSYNHHEKAVKLSREHRDESSEDPSQNSRNAENPATNGIILMCVFFFFFIIAWDTLFERLSQKEREERRFFFGDTPCRWAGQKRAMHRMDFRAGVYVTSFFTT